MCTLNQNDFNKIYEQSLLFNSNCHAFTTKEELVISKPNPYSDVEIRINGLKPHYPDFKTLNNEYLKVMIIDDPKKLDYIESNINPNCFNDYSMVRSSNIFLEFLNKSTDKGQALERLSAYLNISLTETMAIGDAGNDFNMILKAGVGVAMANAFPYVKKAAKFITLDNENSGVAYAINKFILS